MKTFSKSIIATVSGFALLIFPQLSLNAAEEGATTGGSAAGEAAAQTARDNATAESNTGP